MVLARSTQSNKDQKGIGGRIGFTTDSDTADNKPKDDSDIEAESLHGVRMTFSLKACLVRH